MARKDMSGKSIGGRDIGEKDIGGKGRKRDVLHQLTLTSRAARTALSARLAAEGLHSGQDAALLLIARTPDIALRDLADKLAVRPPTVTKTLARLGAQDLVAKQTGAGERRANTVRLTERGESLVENVLRAQAETRAQALAGLSGKQRKTLRKLLKRIERNLGTPDDASAAAGDEG